MITVIEAGHIYEMPMLDSQENLRLTFVNREAGSEHPGIQTQQVLGMQIDVLSSLIDRTNHCDACLRSEVNDKIIKSMTEAQRHLRLALIHHEARALERKVDKGMKPENLKTGDDGHVAIAIEEDGDEILYLPETCVKCSSDKPLIMKLETRDWCCPDCGVSYGSDENR